MTEKIILKVQETANEFIFLTIQPFCEEVLERKICKQELEKILIDSKKYAWHDLRKNSDDLPQLGHDVIFTDIDGFYYMGHTYQCCENCPIEWASNDQNDRIKNVIAWHEIEPFEGVENAIQETPPERVRTCREVAEEQLPEWLSTEALGGIYGCPRNCFPDAVSLCGAEYGANDEMCTECWNQPYPGDET